MSKVQWVGQTSLKLKSKHLLFYSVTDHAANASGIVGYGSFGVVLSKLLDMLRDSDHILSGQTRHDFSRGCPFFARRVSCKSGRMHVPRSASRPDTSATNATRANPRLQKIRSDGSKCQSFGLVHDGVVGRNLVVDQGESLLLVNHLACVLKQSF